MSALYFIALLNITFFSFISLHVVDEKTSVLFFIISVIFAVTTLQILERVGVTFF